MEDVVEIVSFHGKAEDALSATCTSTAFPAVQVNEFGGLIVRFLGSVDGNCRQGQEKRKT
jgi:hypothetical protein